MLVAPPKLIKRRECRQRKNQIINGLLNNYDAETKIGDNVTIDDCIQAPINFKIRGKEIKQEKRDGYNKLNVFLEKSAGTYDDVANHGDIEFTINSDGSLKIVGETTAYRDFYIMGAWNSNKVVMKLKKGFYTCFINSSNPNIIMTLLNVTNVIINVVGNNIYHINAEEDIDITGILIRVQANAEVDETIYPMILEGSYTKETLPPFEKYGQCPSTKFKSEVEHVEGNNEVERINKNLFNSFLIRGHLSTLTGNISSFEGNRLNFNDFILVNDTNIFTLSFKAQTKFEVIIFCYDKNKKFIKNLTSSWNQSPYSFKCLANTRYIKAMFYKVNHATEEIFSDEIYDIQIEKGNKSTPLVEHKSKTYQLSNLPPMYSEDDYIWYDETSKKYFVHNECDKYIVDGINNVVRHHLLGNSVHTAYINDLIDKVLIPESNSDVVDIKSDRFLKASINSIITQKSDSKVGVRTDGLVFFCFGEDSELTTTELMNEYFAENNTEIVYPLENPTDTEITDPVLIEQLDKLRSLLTYEGTNYFIVTSEEGQACNLEVTVYKNSIKIMKNKIDELENRIDALIVDNA